MTLFYLKLSGQLSQLHISYCFLFFQVFQQFSSRFSNPVLSGFYQAFSTLKHFSAFQAVSQGLSCIGGHCSRKQQPKKRIVLKTFAPIPYAHQWVLMHNKQPQERTLPRGRLTVFKAQSSYWTMWCA